MKTSAVYKRPFVQFFKKQRVPFQAVIEDQVGLVCNEPGIGEAKVSDLVGIRVHKFRFNQQEYLLAYAAPTVDPEQLANHFIEFLLIGTHENFYDDLKAYLKSIGWST